MFCASQLDFFSERNFVEKNLPPPKNRSFAFPQKLPLSAYYMTSWTFWGANIDFGLGKSWQQKLLRKELGRAGSREFGRAGSRELGRAGSRELGRAGSKEAGTAEALDFCGENLRFSTWLPQVSSGDLGECLLLSMCWTFSKWSCDVFFFQDLYNPVQPTAWCVTHRRHRQAGSNSSFVSPKESTPPLSRKPSPSLSGTLVEDGRATTGRGESRTFIP